MYATLSLRIYNVRNIMPLGVSLHIAHLSVTKIPLKKALKFWLSLTNAVSRCVLAFNSEISKIFNINETYPRVGRRPIKQVLYEDNGTRVERSHKSHEFF